MNMQRTMTKLDAVLCDLKRTRKRLNRANGRVARRNARREFFGLLKQAENAVNEMYPRIERPKPPAPPKPVVAKPAPAPKPVRRERHAWDINDARLFARVAADFMGVPAIKITFMDDIWGAQHYGRELVLPATMPDKERWDELVKFFRLGVPAGPARETAHSNLNTTYNAFWHEPYLTADLRLAVDHQEWLEKRSRKRKKQSVPGPGMFAARTIA